MSHAMLIATIRETFPDEWVTTQITAVDVAEVPLAGIVLTHSSDKTKVFQAVTAHLATHPDTELYTFFTGGVDPGGSPPCLPSHLAGCGGAVLSGVYSSYRSDFSVKPLISWLTQALLLVPSARLWPRCST